MEDGEAVRGIMTAMKSMLIVVLILGLCGALFFTRPTKADFEKYVREDRVKIEEGKLTGGKTLAEKLGEQMRTAVKVDIPELNPKERFLKEVTYENNILWTNVKKDGQLIFTGAVGHWFERDGGAAAGATTAAE